jgi:hypothetical protein
MLQEAIRKPLSGANGLSLCRFREQLHATAQRTNRLPRNLGQPANLGSYGVLDGYHVAVRDTPPQAMPPIRPSQDDAAWEAASGRRRDVGG